MKGTAYRAATLAAMCCASVTLAHHSISMVEIGSPLWVKGTVTRYEPGHPHVIITLQERTANEELRERVVEGPTLARLERMKVKKDFLKPGDTVEICGFPFKQEVLGRWSPGKDGPPTPPLHGHVLVLQDGRMQPWGPYGKLENCLRLNDEASRWLDLVNSEPMGREYWCNSRRFSHVASVAPKALADKVDREMAVPCD